MLNFIHSFLPFFDVDTSKCPLFSGLRTRRDFSDALTPAHIACACQHHAATFSISENEHDRFLNVDGLVAGRRVGSLASVNVCFSAGNISAHVYVP